MTLAAEKVKGEKELVWLFEIELTYRIEGKAWTQDGTYTNCWWMAHATEGKPSRVRQLLRSTHAISTYTERASLTLCNSNASSWYYDASTGRLYLHTSGSDAPDTASKYYLSSHFWKRFVTGQHPMPNTLYDGDGLFIEPRLAVKVPDVDQAVNEFQEASISQSWSSVSITNEDAKFDAWLATYIWHLCLCYLKVASPGDTYAQFTTVIRGRTGSIGWTEHAIEIRIEDQIVAED